jgi:Fe2+ transport system protein FeoA
MKQGSKIGIVCCSNGLLENQADTINMLVQILQRSGFVQGGTVTVVSEIGGNLIVNVKDSRVAIGKDMASRIIV